MFCKTLDYLPPAWVHLLEVKACLYDGLADYYTGQEQLSEVQEGACNAAAASWSGKAGLSALESNLILSFFF